MNPQSLLLISASLLAVTLDVAPALAQNSKPNVVFILADKVPKTLALVRERVADELADGGGGGGGSAP